jgi:trk system potassium uptake protein TrkH
MDRIRNIRNAISDSSPVAKILSWLLVLESLMLVIPMLLSLILGEEDWKGFGVAVMVSGCIGGSGAYLFRDSVNRLTRRDAFLVISLVWVVYSLVSMIPFMAGAHQLSAASAFFESVSGFTTTGATTIADVESYGRGLLLWRAMTQWIGGLGIVLFLIALLPALNDSGGIMMFNAEITGMTHDKLHPRIKQTAMSLWMVYSGLTLLLIIMLLCGGMSLFDSVCQALATLSTGGFSTRNSSISAWGSQYIATVIAVFMMAGGVNFILLYNALHGKLREMWSNEVFRVYIFIILISSVIVGVYAVDYCNGSVAIASYFHVVSAITSTGFSYADFSAWGSLALLITLVLMFLGACAGSTTGAIKLDRVIAIFKNIRRENMLTVFPNHVSKFKMGGKPVSELLMLRVEGFVGLYFIAFVIGAFAMSAYGYEPFDCIFASASCMGNNGLGYGFTSSGFGNLPDAVKWIFSAEMLIGRLEIFPVMAVLLPSFWRKRYR